MKQHADTALIIIARYPEAGKTKTRLARSIGDEPTAQLYTAFLTDLARRFMGQQYNVYWTYTPAHLDYAAFVAALVPECTSSIHCFPQQGTNLGERLLYAFQQLHARGYQNIILIGSDSPHISQHIIANARAALAESDIVLGPSADGGYYLIAMHHPHDVFTGIPMSTSIVKQRTIELAERQGLTVRCIDELFDIDELPDLLRLARLLETDSQLAPATSACITSLRSLHDHNIHR